MALQPLDETSCVPSTSDEASHVLSTSTEVSLVDCSQSSLESNDESFSLNDSLEVDPSLEVDLGGIEAHTINIHRLRLCVDNNVWTDISPRTSSDELRLCKMSSPPLGSLQLPVITHYLVVHSDLTWSVSIHNHPLNVEECGILNNVPQHLSCDSFNSLMLQLNQLNICKGQPDSHFVSMLNAKKGKIISATGKVAAFVDNHIQATVRTTSCHLLTTSKTCASCTGYRSTLRAMYSRWSRRCSSDVSDASSHSNDRYLSTPEKLMKMNNLKKRARSAEKEVLKLQAKIEELTQRHGEDVDAALQDGLISVMNENDKKIREVYPENSFARVFWEQQLKAASVKSSRQIRWHPLIIKWCINLKLISSAAYHTLRSSGFVQLPSERTLRDYTHYFSSQPGYHLDLNLQLQREANLESLPESRRYIALLLDEMKIKEDLVYDKYSGHIIGFTHLDNVNDLLLQMEYACSDESSHHPPVAKHILVLMVRGIFFKLEFPYAHFSTRSVTADMLFPIVWEGIRQLECMDFKVICVTADGASCNRKFFRMHRNTDGFYRTHNPFADPKEKRMLYFISDPPHLLKTARNCLSHSDGSTGTRWMKVNGKHIEWKHIIDLYQKLSSMAEVSAGLTLLPKLKKEHVELSSFSRMRVDLAAQVLSKSVADALAYFGDAATSETEVFIRNFDRWFDCMNVRSLSEGKAKRKPDLEPYTSPDDSRLKWLMDGFLAYLDSWKTSVATKDSTPESRRKMQLSAETIEGLHLTVRSFVEMTKYLLKLKDSNLFFLSERLSQDPLENYFGRQRCKGGRNDNPNLQQCLNSAAALRLQGSIALDPVRGNCRRKRQLHITEADFIDSALPKRKRKRYKKKK